MRGKVEAAGEYFPVNAKTIFVVLPTNLQAGRLSIGNHENLLIGVLPPAQQIHGKLQACNRIGMVRAHLQIRKVLNFHRPGIVTKYYNIKRILWVAGGNQFTQRHRHLFGRGNPVFPIQNHGMADINHQHGTCLRFKICFPDLQIIFLHRKTFYTMVNLRIADAFGKINLLEGIAKLERLCFRVQFIAHARLKRSMVALLRLFKLSENFFKAAFADALFGLWGNLYFAGLIILIDITLILEVFNKIAHAVFIIGKLILFIQFIQPLKGFRGIAIGKPEHLHEQVKHLLKTVFTACIGIEF